MSIELRGVEDMQRTRYSGFVYLLTYHARHLRSRDHFSRSDPVCIVYMKSRATRNWKAIGKTEMLKNTNDPEWAKTFIINYFFEEKQVIKRVSSPLMHWQQISRWKHFKYSSFVK